MALLEIPLDSTLPDFRQSVQLDGIPYIFEFDYTDRDLSWYMSIYKQTDGEPTPIIEGVRFSVRYPFLLGIVGEDHPPGDLIALDLNLSGDPGREDLGTRVKLYYLEAVVD